MKVISSAALAALQDGTAIATAAIKIACVPPLLVWGGYGQITLGGENYQGVGDRGLVTTSGAAIGDAEQNITLSLSGVEPEVLALFDASQVQQAACRIWLLYFDGSGTVLLDAQVYASGKIDQVLVEETIGGTSTISATVETAARGLGRSGQRMRTDADQRLTNSADGGFSKVSFAGNKTLYWGGKKPTSASTLGWTPQDAGSQYGGYRDY